MAGNASHEFAGLFFVRFSVFGQNLSYPENLFLHKLNTALLTSVLHEIRNVHEITSQ